MRDRRVTPSSLHRDGSLDRRHNVSADKSSRTRLRGIYRFMSVPPLGRKRPTLDYLAPDGSEIRLIVWDEHGAMRASLSEVRLAPGLVSKPVRHRTVEEIWYVLEGEGEVWRCPPDGNERPLAVTTGDAIVIPTRWSFQFAAGPHSPLRFLCYTSPPWPEPGDADDVAYGSLGEPTVNTPRRPDAERGLDDKTRSGRYDQLNILDRKCQALLQLSSFVLAVNVLAPAIGRVGGIAVYASAAAVVAFLVTGLLALSVLSVDWAPGEGLIEGRTHRYRFAIVSTAIGLLAMFVFVVFALLRA